MKISIERFIRKMVSKYIPSRFQSTLILDDRDNVSMHLCNWHSQQQAEAFNADHNFLLNAARSYFPKGRIHIRSYGNMARLQGLGWPVTRPLVEMDILTALGKNAADIQMAIDYVDLAGLFTSRIVVVSSDTDFRPVAIHATKRGIKTALMNFGGNSKIMTESFMDVIELQAPPRTKKQELRILLQEILINNNMRFCIAKTALIARNKISAHDDQWQGCGSFSALCLDLIPHLVRAENPAEFYLPLKGVVASIETQKVACKMKAFPPMPTLNRVKEKL
jgi:hypothetical protein